MSISPFRHVDDVHLSLHLENGVEHTDKRKRTKEKSETREKKPRITTKEWSAVPIGMPSFALPVFHTISLLCSPSERSQAQNTSGNTDHSAHHLRSI